MDFAAIKTQVRILDVLSRYSVRLKGGKNGWMSGDCPLPTHETSKGTFAVNVQDNFWMCHSDSCQAHRGGKKGGDCISFVKAMDNCTDKEAAAKLCKWFNIEQPAQEKAPARIEKGQEDEVQTTPSKTQSYSTAPAGDSKPKYMQETDAWFDNRAISPPSVRRLRTSGNRTRTGGAW